MHRHRLLTVRLIWDQRAHVAEQWMRSLVIVLLLPRLVLLLRADSMQPNVISSEQFTFCCTCCILHCLQRSQPDQKKYCTDNRMLLLSLESSEEENAVVWAWGASKPPQFHIRLQTFLSCNLIVIYCNQAIVSGPL